MNQIGSAALSAVLDLVSQVPDELLTMDSEDYASFVRARADIKDMIGVWTADRTAGHPLTTVQLHISRNPVARIRDAMAKCPDESPAPGTSELNFIPDADLRTNLRNDIGAVTRALSNGEWKAATVLAGSAIEALLLWSLQQHPARNVTASIAALRTSGELTRQPDANLERWDLHEFTEVAANLGIIKADTATEARLAREFRNLIHPGRAQRLGQKCDRGTALSSVAALDHVVRDLSKSANRTPLDTVQAAAAWTPHHQDCYKCARDDQNKRTRRPHRVPTCPAVPRRHRRNRSHSRRR
jgi:hypothetical protein